MKYTFLLSICFVFQLQVNANAFSEEKANGTRHPNVVLIMCDQLIPHLTETYGHEVVKTPSFQTLASQGIVFDAAYTSNPICAPARASLMTGRYSSRIRAWDNASPLGAEIPTICHYLSLANYESVLSGKMHFVGPDQMHGYDKRMIPSIYPSDFRWTKSLYDKKPGSHALSYMDSAIRVVPEGVDLIRDLDGRLKVKRPEFDFQNRSSVASGFNKESHNARFDKWAHFKALDYLDEKRHLIDVGKDTKPFFLTVSYNYPHEAFHPPAELYELYENAPIDLPEIPSNLKEKYYSAMDEWLVRHHGLEDHHVLNEESITKVRRAYYALVHFVDLMVGEILDSLKRNGFDDNTLIIFTSDHGDMLMEKGMVQKRSFYEWSSRIPLIVKYPDGRFAGMRIDEPVSIVDIVPTILDVVGIKIESSGVFDGESLLPWISGEVDRDRVVFSEMHSEGVYAPCFMVRKGDFKYNYFHGVGSQLFDLKEDSDEWDNLSGQRDYMEIENELREALFKRFNPELIASQVNESLNDRKMVQPVLRRQNIDWGYVPSRNY